MPPETVLTRALTLALVPASSVRALCPCARASQGPSGLCSGCSGVDERRREAKRAWWAAHGSGQRRAQRRQRRVEVES